MEEKHCWHCDVCGDIHWGDEPPSVCPTCDTRGSYVEIPREEALETLETEELSEEEADEIEEGSVEDELEEREQEA